MEHANEMILRDLHEKFSQGDIDGFLSGCTDQVTFTVPGKAAVSGEFSRARFMDLIAAVMERSGGTFREDVLDVFANDYHRILLLRHTFERDGQARKYRSPTSSSLRVVRSRSGQSIPGACPSSNKPGVRRRSRVSTAAGKLLFAVTTLS